MPKAASPIPAGYHTATPYLIVKNASAAIDFYKKAFNAIEIMRMPKPDGRIGHAEIKIGDSQIMLADEFPEMDILGPESLAHSPVSILLYVPDVDKIFQQATAAGATVIRSLQNQFYGDRSGFLRDPFGHMWGVATRIEDLTDEELQQRYDAMIKQNPAT